MNKNTSVTIRIDSKIKEEAQLIFSDLGMDMSTAINIFLKQTIRHKGFPFELTLNIPNEVTLAAIEEGKRIAKDSSIPKYNSVDELIKEMNI